MSAETTFRLPSGRELLTEGKTKEYISTFDKGFDRFKRIELGGKSFGREAAAALATTIAEMTNLEEVDLSDIIAGRAEDEALEVLEIISSAITPKTVREINLSDNALGAKGIKACRRLLQGQERLEKLYINNNGLAADAISLLTQILVPEDKKTTSLTHLRIFNNLLVDAGAAALVPLLEASPNLIELQISATRFGEKGGLSVATGLRNVKFLNKLNLTDNTFGGAAAKPLSEVLARSKDTIQSLVLRYCSLEDDGAEQLLGALTDGGANLEEVDLIGNDLTKSTFSVLGKFLEGKDKLKVLKIGENDIWKLLKKVLPVGKRTAEDIKTYLSDVEKIELLMSMDEDDVDDEDDEDEEEEN